MLIFIFSEPNKKILLVVKNRRVLEAIEGDGLVNISIYFLLG